MMEGLKNKIKSKINLAYEHITNGYKMDLFVMGLSFIGWAFLSVITLGIVYVFWYDPYKQNTDAALYAELSQNSYV